MGDLDRTALPGSSPSGDGATPTSGRTRLSLQAAAIAGGWVPLSIAASQSVALRMEDFGSTTATYSLIVAAGWAVSMTSLPLMGHVGDVAVRRGIDRRALLIIGGIAMLACFGLLGTVQGIAAFALVWMLAQIPTSLIVTAASSRLAHEAPVELRGWASTAAGLSPVIAITIGASTTLILSEIPAALFLAPAIVGVILLLPSLVMRPLATRADSSRRAPHVRAVRLFLAPAHCDRPGIRRPCRWPGLSRTAD